MANQEKSCCAKKTNDDKRGVLSGVIYGLIPHSFCIAYIIFSVIGATVGMAIFRNFFLVPYFFQLLIAASFILATISAAVYLRKQGILSISGVKRKWKYLTVLYGTVILTNLLFFFVVFPATANININKNQTTATSSQDSLSLLILKVEIPCSGHAPLISDEIKKINGVSEVRFESPNIFYVKYDKNKTSTSEIKLLDIFKTYKATAI